MSFITLKYIIKDEMIKHTTRKRKFSLVFSIITKEITSHTTSFPMFKARNFIAEFSFPHIYFLKIKYTTRLKISIKRITIKQSKKYILQK